MNLLESVKLALTALAVNKLRSSLTMLGIVIGVAAVIILLSVGQGLKVFVRDSFTRLGSNLLTVTDNRFGNGRTPWNPGQPLTMADTKALTDKFQVPDVLEVAPSFSRDALIIWKNKEIFGEVIGVTPAYARVRNYTLSEGQFISDEDVAGRTRIALLGAGAAAQLFDPTEALSPVGQIIKLNNFSFRIQGILKAKGNGLGGDEDNIILIPISTAQARLFSAEVYRGSYIVSTIFVKVISADRMEAAIEQINEVLRARHQIDFSDNDDFSILDQTALISVIDDITTALTLFLGSIASVSLLVGGIGIMNIMLVSVTERTREIGLRKAVGAKRHDILAQFLTEAIVIAVMGGVIGIGIGITTSLIVQNLADFNPIVTPGAILLATTFSIGIGLFFGVYPATRAARLNPIDALRYE